MVTANLTVLREFNGTDHWPNGVSQSIALNCDAGSGNMKDAHLSVVLINQVSGTVQEVNTFTSGAIGATKIVNACSSQVAYVKEIIWDVQTAQHPCCDGSGTPPPPPTFDTVIQFADADTDTGTPPGAGITGTIEPGTTDSVRKIEFNKIDSTTGLPVDMTVYNGSISSENYILTVTYPAEYAGHQCRVTKRDGTQVLTTFRSTTGDKLI